MTLLRPSYATSYSVLAMFEHRPLGDAVSTQRGGGTPSRQVGAYWGGPIPWASVKDFAEGGSEILSTQEAITERGLRASASNLIPPGTPLVCTRMAVGRSAMAPMPTAINQDVKALIPSHGTDAAYLLRLLQYIQPKAEAAAVGSTVKGIRIQDYLSISVPWAPAVEQPLIVSILDTLDTTIRQTQAIIEKLKQVKQGLLHDLLTRGIAGNGELRPPQSEAPHLYKESALGWLPACWTAAHIQDLASFVTSGSRGWAAHYSEAGALFIRSQNVRMGYLDFSDRQHVRPTSGSEGQRTKVAANDLLVTITGNGVGNLAFVPAHWNEEAFVSQHVGLVRFFESRLAQLAMLYLVEGAPGNHQLVDAQYGQSKPGLNLENLRRLQLPVPPTIEQVSIVERLGGLQDRIELEKLSLAQNRMLKSGLMDDLLTGRVRVTALLNAET